MSFFEQAKEKNNLLCSDESITKLKTIMAVEWKERHGKVYFHESFQGIIKATLLNTRFRTELGVKDKVT